MTIIGFLACPATLPAALPGEAKRRGDAFEHDLQIAAYGPAFAKRDLTLEVIDWRAPLEAFDGIKLALLGTAWDYQDAPHEFLAKLEALERQGVTICNSPNLVRWNMQKTYLRELEERGAQTIPTLWFEQAGKHQIEQAMDHFAADSVVVKRQIGAGALGQLRFSADDMPDDNWQFHHPAMVQPFLPQIASEGELSFIFIGGEFSHALIKKPAAGDYRIQSLYGGYETALAAQPQDIAAAHAVLASLPHETPLYARIDMVRSEKGALLLMEAEMIEPYLYPEQGPQLGDNLAKAIQKRIEDR